MNRLTFYTYPSCTSCRKTKKWLKANDIHFHERHLFRETPTAEEIKQLLHMTTEGVDELIATRSVTFKNLDIDFDNLHLSDVVELLAKEPKLLRRPILTDGERVVVGHNIDALKNLIG
ncbi:Spx/MgsR family RNA polymerase-binding regulatory protein [Peribacillus sp. SCS-155]|uniref:Spx/MgsR family RNA polymerase-binding regulatory protein n=1 Tax=Peribacillus sedimenti TaxID=3115297 RepID=UPI0039066CB5